MSIIRNHPNHKQSFVTLINHSLMDSNLSFEAVGLWARLSSRPPNWHVSVIELSKTFGCSKDKIYRMLNELIKNGYAYREQKNISGQFQKYETHIFSVKATEEEIKEMFPQPAFPEAVISCENNGIQKILPQQGFPVSGFAVTGKTDANKERINKDLNKKENIEKNPSPKPDSSPAAMEVCVFLLDQIKKQNPNFKKPNLKKWEEEVDLILRIDKRTTEELKQVITWAFSHSDPFWSTAILSPKTLRKLFDKAWMLLIKKSLHSNPKLNNRNYIEDFLKRNRNLISIIEVFSHHIEIQNGSPYPYQIQFDDKNFEESVKSLLNKMRKNYA